MDTIDSLIQGLATAVPVIVTSLIVLYKFKSELCKQISDLKVEVQTHIRIADNHEKEFHLVKEKLTNIIMRNNLKY
ncbi:MAG: hypothetical protein KC444_09200 [Nitrosopumilus sp.]|nr:hypothetical protein [Nitrosopumilus sp.]